MEAHGLFFWLTQYRIFLQINKYVITTMMKTTNSFKYLIIFTILILSFNSNAQNPIIRNQFTADPSARVFNGKVYLFPSHDIRAPEGINLRKDWFCMADYHVFSSENLTDWSDNGVIVSQNKTGWVDSSSYSMWAPDCIARNGKYYFYFPANSNKATFNGRKGFGTGVAIAEQPEGPYISKPEPIKGAMGIDPNVFIDTDGQPYLIWAMGRFSIAKLKDNMIELASDPQQINGLPDKGLKEGPWLFERNGTYYLTYPHVQDKIERLEYATSDNIMGPYKFTGVIMDESPMNCWTNHQSVVEFNGQWYLFYHQNALSPKFDKNRSVCIDSLFFNADGTIKKVTPTLRGVGVTNASQMIQIDRYSQISQTGLSVEFNDSLNTFNGWKVLFNSKNSWVRYNAVDFDNKTYNSIKVKAFSKTGGIIQLSLADNNGNKIIAKVKIPKCTGWITFETKLKKVYPGLHDLFITSLDKNPVEIDWISFE
jgi:hypothetical protein